MKRILMVGASLLAVLLAAGCAGSGSGGVPEGWEVHLVRNLSYQLPKGWEKEDVGYGGYYFHPPDGGLLMVTPASWGLSDLSTEEGAAEAFAYQFGVMDRNLPGFQLVAQEEFKAGSRYAVRADFTVDGSEDTTLSGVAYLLADNGAGEVFQFVFVLDGEPGGELESSMEEIINSIGGTAKAASVSS